MHYYDSSLIQGLFISRLVYQMLIGLLVKLDNSRNCSGMFIYLFTMVG